MCEDDKKVSVGSVDVSTLPEVVIPSDDSAKMVQAHTVATYNTLMKVSQAIYEGGMFPNAKSAAGIFTIVLYGHEHGVEPITALNEIHIIHGRLGFSAQFIHAKLQRAGINVQVLESDASHCLVEFTGREKPHRELFTMEEAKKAGLVKHGGGYDKWAKDMLFCRAMTRGARRYAPGAILGMYDVNELTALPDATAPEKPKDNGKSPTTNLSEKLANKAGTKPKEEKPKKAPKKKAPKKTKEPDPSTPPEPENVEPTKEPEPLEPEAPVVSSEDFITLIEKSRDEVGDEEYETLKVKYGKRRTKDWSATTRATEMVSLREHLMELMDAPSEE